MRRALAPTVAVLLLHATTAGATEPLEFNLSQLGAPTQEAWTALGVSDPAAAKAAADDAKKRFASFSIQTLMAMSSSLLIPASTTGHSGFDIAFEASYTGVDPKVIGSNVALGPPLNATFTAVGPFPSHHMTPYELTVMSLHVRKSLPFSLEFGGRLMYLAQSATYGTQLEAKWALNEGLANLPDIALRIAHTRAVGTLAWNAGVTEFDVLVSKRFGVNAVASLTPYGAARFSFVNASSSDMSWSVNPAAPAGIVAAFPTLNTTIYRTTLGLRFTTYAVSLAAEGTYFAGASVGSDSGNYPKQSL